MFVTRETINNTTEIARILPTEPFGFFERMANKAVKVIKIITPATIHKRSPNLSVELAVQKA